MPLREYRCKECGVYETLCDDSQCPVCGASCVRLMSAPARIKVEHKENLPYGNKSKGRFISHKETGGSDILIPSWGALEKEEVDYLAEAMIEKEKTHKRQSPMKDNMEAVTKALLRTPMGERREMLNEITGGV